MTKTATAFSRACSQLPVAKPQRSTVMAAITSTAGTKTALTRSTKRCIGAFLACADSTMRTMRASVVSAPMAVVSMTSRPAALSEPPVTLAPTSLATGRLSPVISDSSISLLPSTTVPSTGKRSPGRTTTKSPCTTWSIANSISAPSRRTRAVSGRSAFRAWIASVVWFLARASRYLPSKTSVMTTAEASK